MGGKVIESLSWETETGSTSQSPVHERVFGHDLGSLPTRDMLRHLFETLELPGEAGDYHFAIQDVVAELWSRRRDEPEVFGQLEALAWLDVNFVQAHPAAITSEYGDEPGYYQVRAFHDLVFLYEREGAWRDALAVTVIADRFEQPNTRREALLERVAALDAEGAG